MAIDFTAERWQRIKNVYADWWAGTLKRPIAPLPLIGRDPGRPQPAAPLLSQRNCHDLTIPADDIVDRIDWELSRYVYLGDSFPWFGMDVFGPGVVAAFAGARLDNSAGSVWFHPQADIPITDLHLEYDPDNVWLRRIKELCAAMMKRWQGQVQVTMTDLGGSLDILSTFRPGENLLMDLYDHPDHVLRVLNEAHEIWHRAFAEINAVLQPHNPGYMSWCQIYSDRPYYIFQCDFSYMISPDMFQEFVLPELDRSTRRLDRSFYHLDGKGQLPHLDMLLSLPRLDGVQWISGAGQPGPPHWPEVFERIIASGKKSQIVYGGRTIDAFTADFNRSLAIVRRFGLGGGAHLRCDPRPIEDEPQVRRLLGEIVETNYPTA